MKKTKGIHGFMEAYLTDINGKKRKIHAHSNVFYADFGEALAKHLDNNYDIALDNLFSTTTPGTYEDGIIALDGVNWIAFVSTVTQPAANQLRVTGVYTNATGSSVNVTAPGLGKGWVASAFGIVPPFNDFRIAMGELFPSTSVPNGETLTIVWTITFTPH